MNVWKQLRSLFGGEKVGSEKKTTPPPTLPVVDDEPEVIVPEISVDQLQTALASSLPPLLIDVREPYEWRLVRIASARHIPMNDIPAALETIPRDRPVVVLCAHGSRSYSVAAWLIEQGIDAVSLAGGITQWAGRGGAVEQGTAARGDTGS